GAHVLGRLLDLVEGATGRDDVGAFGRAGERDPLPDPLSRAGDEHDLAVQPAHGVLRVFRFLTGRQVIVRSVDLRYSPTELAFRDELREWLATTRPAPRTKLRAVE